ncbi:M48 family metallopeptidase [Algoriphagus sp.]|uniref:M48 family metallopeptidase n=1 Tax=Algoriphagus sp. TaxID=1872435 RepID=UPI00391D7592
MKKIILVFAAGLLAYSCSTVPLTGRRSLSMVSNDEIQPLVNDEYKRAVSESKNVTGTANGQAVVRVGQRMAKAVEAYLVQEGYQDLVNDFSWEFNLLESDQINAWCMPGGKVAFYTGILPITKDEAGIAVVMGHEIAHAVASHARERMSNGMLLNGLLGGASAAMGQNPTMMQQILLQGVGAGSQLGMLSFSRKHELEADEMGLIFMAMAGYDPRTAPAFWQRMAAAGGGAPPEFLSTHPGPDRRIERLNANMPKALKYYKP